MRYLFSIILFVAILAMIVFWDRPLWQEIQDLQNERGAFESTVLKITDLRKTRDNLIQTYNSISQKDIKRVNKMVPDKAATGSLIVQMANLTNESNLLLKSINISEAGGSGGTDGSYQVVDLSLTVSGSYSRFLKFLEKIEKSLRLIDVTSISFTIAGAVDSQDFSLEAKSYLLR